MQAKPLNIKIPKPCSQNFAEMPKQEDGLYCGQCTKIVYDFSMMTDYELLQFFKTKPDVHCGKFHNSQLNRNIEPVIVKNKFLHKISAIAASVFALIALKPNTAKAQGELRKYPTAADSATRNTTTVFRDSINIKGVVKNEKNEPLQNVVIRMDGVGEIKTDTNGQYDFGIITVKEAHNIYYSCPNYVPVVRTYNVAMGSTIMDIVMGHRDSNAIIMDDHLSGVMMLPSFDDMKFTNLFFKGNSNICSDGNVILYEVASKLKSNPFSNILITAFGENEKTYKLAIKKLENIRKYLVVKQGISEDRISLNSERKKGKNDIVEITAQ